MPKIRLKPKSAEYDEEDSSNKHARKCEMPGCDRNGEYKAPKDKHGGDYHYFCLEHVKEYNEAWNYFNGMSKKEIEDYIYNSLHGNRPTWKYGVNGNPEEELRFKAWNFRKDYESDTAQQEKEDKKSRFFGADKNSPEYEAMIIMGIEPPITMESLKKRYKELVKLYHPDVNKNSPGAEEKLKSINMSYTILKMAHEKFTNL